jgi:hypothetical protein
VTGTRVTLDVIVHSFENGATPEQIAQAFPTAELRAVYAVLAWVVNHEAEVRAYLARRAACAAEVRAEVERRFPQRDLRARLLARRVE